MTYNSDKRNLQIQYQALLDNAKQSPEYYVEENECWTFFRSRKSTGRLPSQGFKIHLSATICNLNTIFELFYNHIKSTNLE